MMPIVIARVLVLYFLFFGTLIVSVSFGDEVSINAQNEPIKEVLLRLEKNSGIRFMVTSSLGQERITASIRAATWSEISRQLLEGYNLVTLADDQNNLTKVVLLGRKSGFVAMQTPLTRTILRPMDQTEIVLKVDQLRELAKGPFRSPLPVAFFHNPDYRDILAQYGIESKKDMTDVRKAMRVRVEVRRQLTILQKDKLVNKS